MTPAPTPAASPGPVQVGALLFPGYELLDIYGPLEMFGMLRERVAITMLAPQAGPVASAQGPSGVADVGLGEASGFEVLLVPGGRGTRALVKDEAFLELLRTRAHEARYVASICTGSALLARAGLLDGRRATTNKIAFDWVVTQGPAVAWVRRARWIEDGKFFTSSGVSAGMDMALSLISVLFGREAALGAARYAEYLWNEDSTDDPFARDPASPAR